MKKKFLIIFSFFILVLFVASCGKDTEPTNIKSASWEEIKNDLKNMDIGRLEEVEPSEDGMGIEGMKIYEYGNFYKDGIYKYIYLNEDVGKGIITDKDNKKINGWIPIEYNDYNKLIYIAMFLKDGVIEKYREFLYNNIKEIGYTLVYVKEFRKLGKFKQINNVKMDEKTVFLLEEILFEDGKALPVSKKYLTCRELAYKNKVNFKEVRFEHMFKVNYFIDASTNKEFHNLYWQKKSI